MINFPIYQAEVECGLADKIKASASLKFLSEIKHVEPTIEQATAVAEYIRTTLAPELAKASIAKIQPDLFYMNTVLASIGWNKNDDVFDAGETWVARNTPVHKQVNYEHNEKDIIGTTVASLVMTQDGKIVPDDCQIVPEVYDIVNADVLYKRWEDPKLQARMDKLIAEILEGKWAVSMECLFKNFDYAVITPAGENKVIARNNESAFLTKHLRFYGGSGEYGGNKIGRLLRSFVFSGKGMVTNPANPRSLILTDDVNPFKTNSNILNPIIITEEKAMADNVEVTLRDELAKANTRAEQLASKLNEQVEAARAAERERLEKTIAAHKAEIETLKAKVDAQAKEATEKDAAKAEVQKKLEAETLKLAEAEKKIEAARVAQVKASRIAQLVAVKVTADDATKVVEKWATATDEQFADIVTLHAKKNNDAGDKDEEATKDAYKGKDVPGKDKAKSEVTGDLDKAKLDAADPALAAAGAGGAESGRATASNWLSSILKGTQSIQKENKKDKE